MSSIDIKTAQQTYKAETEYEMLQKMAQAYGCRLIYKYANHYGDKLIPTDYKIIMVPGDAQEQAFLNSPLIHNAVLIYQDGNIVNECLANISTNGDTPDTLTPSSDSHFQNGSKNTSEGSCPKCGNLVGPADIFCRVCGATLQNKTTPAEIEKQPTPISQQESQVDTNPNNILSPFKATKTELDLGGNKVQRKSATTVTTVDDLKKDLREWGVGMILWGVLSLIFTKFLDPVWGIVIIILGLVNLVVMKRGMYIINGLALIFVGISNISTIFFTILNSGISSFWVAYGFMQIGWGFREIIKFAKNSWNPWKQFSTYPVGTEGSVARYAVIPIERKDIEIPSIVGRQHLDQNVDRLARLWIAEERPNRAELMIGGYHDDPRELYEIPEVCAWAKHAVNEIPVLPYFLTSTSLDRFTGWLCGPLTKDELMTNEFRERFIQTKNTIFDDAVKNPSSYFNHKGANKSTISKIYSQILANQDEVIKAGEDGHMYTAAVRDKQATQKFRKQLLGWKVATSSPRTVIIGLFIGLGVIGGITALVFSGSESYTNYYTTHFS